MNDKQLRAVNALTLQWHAGASSVGYEAFRPWVLAGLKAELPFDGAVWGSLSPAGAPVPHVAEASVHGLDAAVLQPVLELDRTEPRTGTTNGSAGGEPVLNICLADARWHGPAHEALRAQAGRHGMANAMTVRFIDAHAPGRQFVLLSRKSATHRFTAGEAAQFEWLAPHMMQAFATRRRVFLDKATSAGQGVSAVAVAMVDRDGFVHDRHAHFVALLRREWNDWPGQRLPEPLLDLLARRGHISRRFVGLQMSVELLPAGDLCVAIVRPRHRADGLTEREGDVARRYAAGGSFREVAESLNVSPATVRSHLRNVFGKLRIRNKSQLATVLQQAAP